MAEPTCKLGPLEIVNERGLHARASASLSRLAATLPSEVTIIKGSDRASALSILDLMMLGAAKGESVTLEADGDGAQASCAAVQALIEDGFGEL